MSHGLEQMPQEQLDVLHDNLLKSLDTAVGHMEAGTLDVRKDDHSCSPRVTGYYTVMMLQAVMEEQGRRYYGV